MTEQERSEQPGFMIQGTESFKIAQALYNTVTGKTEKLSKRFSENYKIGMNDVFQLHAKFEQMCAQWNVIEKNENITIHHVNDNKETFSSIERFKVYDQSQTSPVESIVYEFNVLIQLNNTPKPQPYTITVRLGSKVAMHQKVKEEMSNRILFRLFRGGAINVDIEYIDYVVARNMISTLDSWVSSIESTKTNKYLKYFQNFSHRFEDAFSVTLCMLALLASISSVGVFIDPQGSDQNLARFLLVSSGFILAFFFLGKVLGGLVESGVDHISQISYIKINVGDERAILAASRDNKISFLKAAISFFLISVHAVGCSYIASIIYSI